MVVMLTDSTDVGQVEGLLKARSKQMSMAALIPGLAVSVEGAYNNQNVLVASKVRFKGSDLKNAKAIAAGMHDTNQQVQKNQEELAKHNAELQAQHEALQKHEQAIAANKAAVDAAIARFGQLDDYYIIDNSPSTSPTARPRWIPSTPPRSRRSLKTQARSMAT